MGKRGFWQAAVSLDGTHAQWRTFVSLTLVFILPMVGCSHGWSVLPHTEVCSSSLWPIDSRAESEAISPHAQAGILMQKSGMSFLCIFLLGASFSSRTDH